MSFLSPESVLVDLVLHQTSYLSVNQRKIVPDEISNL